MQTNVRNPLEIFSMPQRLEVPVFQRRYVWSEGAQWEPLWRDIAAMAEALLAGRQPVPHFLGAVVTQSSPPVMGSLPRHAVIDGQQRLTTLQLVFDAAASVLQAVGLQSQAGQLSLLTHNPQNAYGDGSLKLHHENDDGPIFHAVMQAEPPIDYAALHNSSSNITEAHRYFADRTTQFLGDPADPTRAQALMDALCQGLQLVVIGLDADEPAQEIFETLNARGTPLTAADLIKNFAFQQVQAEGGDPRAEYRAQWKPLESRYWDTEISVGRYTTPRLTLFLNYWLVAHTAQEVSPRSTFTRFKSWYGSQTRSMGEVLASLNAQAELYKEWEDRSAVTEGDLNAEQMFVYRARAVGVDVVKPLLLWLYDVDRRLNHEVARQALQDVESWMMRRALMGLTTSDYGRLVAGMLAEMDGGDASGAADRLRQYLVSQNRPSTYWPGDVELRTVLRTSEIYYQPRTRLRAYLEAVEDHLRGYRTGRLPVSAYSGSRVRRNYFTIEHLLPQHWRANWPTAADPDSIVDRDMHVHRLGNLTLLTQSLNSSVSNSAWLDRKRAALAASDTLLLTRAPRERERWDEAAIDERSELMIDALLQTWPAPPDHAPVAVKKTQNASTAYADLRTLVETGQVAVGTRLRPGWGERHTEARVLADGRLDLDGTIHASPSGAASALLGGGAVNGWQFWRTPDGRELRQLRA